ncbi:hypothetical protein GCM10022419_009120 [Nonomuraea rosea]|uniref:AB hydrolase-1 domain-containing protein n=1 Tax=Nonomuraea rosea TaxID=638574 RepID=A0ABP6VE12_9ACTN
MSAAFTVPAADTQLSGTDTPGKTPSLVFLNGGFATQKHWGRVLERLGGAYRTVTYDGRARGKSGTSADYSMRGALDDVGRVIEATGVERPVLVGWSNGATLAVRYATEHPDKVGGLVLIDGAYPITMFDEAGKEGVRRQFRRMGWLLRVAARLGLAARMTPDQCAQVVIDTDATNGEFAADFAALRVPAAFVVCTGPHSGASEEETSTMRAAAAKATAINEHVTVFATAPSNHVQVLSKDAALVADAVEDVVSRSAA